jgi:subfamily B ATP-binding cassette protein MsbA
MSRMIVAVICIILAAGGNVAVPWIIKDVIDQVLINKDMAMLNIIAIGILIIFLFRGIFFFGQTYLMSYIGQRVIIDIREAVYRQLQRLSLAYFDKRQTGVIMSSVTNDVSALQVALVESMVEMVTEAMVLLGSLGSMFFLHWKLSLLTLITMPLVLQAINTFGKKLRKAVRFRNNPFCHGITTCGHYRDNNHTVRHFFFYFFNHGASGYNFAN